MKVGIAGLGRMGSVYADRLLQREIEVYAWNRSAPALKAAAEKGAKICPTPATLVSNVDVLLVSLAHEAALDDFYKGPGGVLELPNLSGRTIVETSTVTPAYVETVGASIRHRGGIFLDAPVLGTVGPAKEGKLVFTVGGSFEDIDPVVPVLSLLGRRIAHMGPIGAGSSMKLVVNQCLCVYFAALGEAMAMGERRGLDVGAALDVLLDSAVASPALRGKLSVITGEEVEVGFNLAGARKDLAAALDAAGELRSPVGAAALSAYDEAIARGWGERDVAAIVSLAR